MTHKTFIFAVLLSAPFIAAAQKPEKTMLKSFNLEGKNHLTVMLPGSVETKEWDKPSVQVQISVSLPAGNAGLLTELANVGRYNLTIKPEGERITVTADNLHKVIKIKGMELKENINFIVFVPKGTIVNLQDPIAVTAAVVKN